MDRKVRQARMLHRLLLSPPVHILPLPPDILLRFPASDHSCHTHRHLRCRSLLLFFLHLLSQMPSGNAPLPVSSVWLKILFLQNAPAPDPHTPGSYDGVTRPQGGYPPEVDISIAARPDTYYNYLTQSAPPNAPPRRRWSRRPALFFVRSVFRHPAAPPAHRHCPRR